MMTLKLVDTYEFSRRIGELMIESEDSANPNVEHNAYNWGLAHADLLLRGVTVESIKEMQPNDLR
jgi:hypothetical protein